MKVKQPQHVDPSGLFDPVDDFQQFGGSQSELGGFASGFFPASRSLRVKLDAHSDHRRVAFMSFSDAQDVIQFAQFLDHDDDALAGLRAGKSQLNELFIFESI